MPPTLLTLLASLLAVAAIAGLLSGGAAGLESATSSSAPTAPPLDSCALPPERLGRGLPGAAPKAGRSAGRYRKLANASSLAECVAACCADAACHSALLYRRVCYTIACVSADACAPKRLRSEEAAESAVYLPLRAVCRRPRGDCGGGGGASSSSDGYLCFAGACHAKRRCTLLTIGNCGAGEKCSFSSGDDESPGGVCECRSGFKRAGLSRCELDVKAAAAARRKTTTTRTTPLPMVTTSIATTTATPEAATTTVANKNATATTIAGDNKVSVSASVAAAATSVAATAASISNSNAATNSTAAASTTAPSSSSVSNSSAAAASTATATVATTTTPKREKLMVSAGSNRTIELPENSIELHASVIPEPTGSAAKRLSYSWKVISGPRSGQFQNRNSANLKLSELVAGKYVLQVDVTDSKDAGRVGKAVVMVTVRPAKRKSKPPQAVIKPKSLTIQLPNNAILDGSRSVDGDQKIESYKWQVVDGPLSQDMHGVALDQQILQLNNLREGFYVLRLTVQDAKGLSDSATANLTVLPEQDDKPKASAGQSKVIYLPLNNITLYGNASTDDHGIVSYMWRQKGGSHLSADMQGVHTAFLHLSGLVEGDYAFELTVKDARGQSDSATVNVLVKRRRKNSLPVVALKPAELTVELPLARLVLNATASDDTGVKSWRWTLISGPGSPQLANETTPSVTLSGLRAGVYRLRAAVTDLDGAVGSAVAMVTVKPGPNQRPKARAGGDRVVQLDGTGSQLVVLDGSQSWDDKAIVTYKWTRKGVSLAVGQVLNGSDSAPRMLLIGLLPGRYSFRLEVRDAEGAADTDEAAVLVRAWPHAGAVASLELHADPAALRQSDLTSLLSQMQLSLRGPHPDCGLRLLGVRPRLASVVLRLAAEFKNGTYLAGPRLVALLKHRLPATLLEFPVAGLHTEVCQLGCSGRGYCDNATRQCVCASFWMENPIRRRYGDGDSNCDWSVVYVSLSVTLGLLLLCACAWLLYCCCWRYRRAAGAHLRAKAAGGGGGSGGGGGGGGRHAGRRLRRAAAAALGVGGSRDKVYYAPLNNGNESGHMSFSLSSDEEDTVYSRRAASDPSLLGGGGGGGGGSDHNSNRIPMANMAGSNGSTAKDK